MHRWKAAACSLALFLFAVALGSSGCELIAGVDRNLIPGNTGGGVPSGGDGGTPTGGGGSGGCDTPADCGVDTDCLTFACDSGDCSQNVVMVGTECDEDGGEVCDGNGNCLPANCMDTVQNADETDIDCGGSCMPCDNGELCLDGDDCISGACDNGGAGGQGGTSGGVCAPCVDDIDCNGTGTFYCALGQCEPEGVNGDPCTNANQCTSGNCSDDVCCDATCGGACDACSVAAGATTDGNCEILADAAIGDPSCAPYLCDGISAVCPDTCATTADCGASITCTNNFCCDTACTGTCESCAAAENGGTDGICGFVTSGTDPQADCTAGDELCDGAGVCKLILGETCSLGTDCLSGNCIDGVCCNTSCGADCQSCDNSGSVGTCSTDANGSACPSDGTFCNGVEACQAGTCASPGDPCDGPDGDGDCSETCDEGNADCDGADSNGTTCTDSLFCNGGDTCNAGVCSSHTGDPCPGPDGDGDCTETCNEAGDNCDNPDTNGSACTDMAFCNGTETCTAGTCGSSTGDPCPGPDGDGDCTETCNEAGDNCDNPDTNGSACTDLQFCNGAESCTAGTCGSSTGDPCPGPDGDIDCSETCDEAGDNCDLADTNGSVCDDLTFCNGGDTCSAGLCATHTGDPCPGPDGDGDCTESCDEGGDTCDLADTNGSACTDMAFCNGTETCTAGTCGSSTGDPCPGPDGDGDCTETCDEAGDNCDLADTNGSLCTDGAFCNGAEACTGGVCGGSTGNPCSSPDDCDEGGGGQCIDVWINEFHYDNLSTDANEFVEVAVPTGANLSNIVVHIYNGSSGFPIAPVLPLTGFTAGSSSNGVTFYSFTLPVNGLQNDTEGFCVVVGSTVVEFISYEGSFLASGGPCTGLTSTNLPVFEAGSGASTQSMGLIGAGGTSADFTWAVPLLATPGDPNAGQTIN